MNGMNRKPEYDATIGATKGAKTFVQAAVSFIIASYVAPWLAEHGVGEIDETVLTGGVTAGAYSTIEFVRNAIKHTTFKLPSF